MTAKSAQRRRLRRQESKKGIQSFFERSSDSHTSALRSKSDTDLFTVDTTGGDEAAGRGSVIAEQPLIRRLSKAKKETQPRFISKKRLKSKIARYKRKMDRVFDIWEETGLKPRDLQVLSQRTGNRVHGKLGQGLRPNLNAVPVAHPGCSCNPDPQDHADALDVQRIEEARSRGRKEEKVDEQEVKENGGVQIKEEEDTDEKVEGTGILYRSKIKERKTKAQRNKEARHKELLKSDEDRKEIRTLHAQIANLKQINKEIDKDLERRHQNNLIRKVRKQRQKMKRGLRKIGKKVIKSTKIQVLGADDLAASLRKLHVSNDLALDRYVSLQKRGLLDAGQFRGRRNKTRYKYSLVGDKERRIEAAKKEMPIIQKKVQDLRNQLQKMKMAETSQ